MDPRMMNAWLLGQTQKVQVTEAEMQRKRLGIGLTEQLSPAEEKYARSHKSMMTSMIKQYGKEKGTRVFYATVRDKVKKLQENTVAVDTTPEAEAMHKKLAKEELKQKSTIKSSEQKDGEGNESTY